jgi:uncharacterized protein (DUF1697 family)
MPKYIAFLRAINVGGHVVKMDHLRTLFSELGFSKVETLIASGNVIFDSASRSPQALERKIEKYLHQSLGYEVATFIRSPSEVVAITGHKPFKDSDLKAPGHILYIGFVTQNPGDDAYRKLLPFITPVDDFHVHLREVYWLRRTLIGESTFSYALLERALKMPATFRNMTTVKKIALKYG